MAENINDKQLSIKFGGKKLVSKDKLSKNDSYFEIYKNVNNNYNKMVYKSEVIDDNNDPIWKECEIKLSELCSCDMDKELYVKVFDKDKNGSDFVGECKTNWNELKNDKNGVMLIDQDGAESGVFYVSYVDEEDIGDIQCD